MLSKSLSSRTSSAFHRHLVGGLFGTIWNQAEDDLVKADHIAVIEYSFPRTTLCEDARHLGAVGSQTGAPAA